MLVTWPKRLGNELAAHKTSNPFWRDEMAARLRANLAIKGGRGSARSSRGVPAAPLAGTIRSVTMLRFRSAESPFDDPMIAGQAARLLSLAEAVGLWQPGRLVVVLDGDVFSEALHAIAEAGVATYAPFEWESYAHKSSVDFVSWMNRVRIAVAESPVPEIELPRLDALFGAGRLAESVGVAESSLRRYVDQIRETPDLVAERAHLLTRIVGDLSGSYNERGVRRWFERPRSQLDGRAPAEILKGDWSPDDPDVVRVAALAGELVG